MIRILCSAFLLSVGIFELALADTPIPKKVVVGEQAPAFKIQAASGQMIDLADLTFKGPVLVRLTCGCAGCDKELTYFQEINNAYKKQGLTCVFVFKEPDSKVAKYAVEKKLTMIYAVDTKGESWKTFQTQTMPTNFLIEKGGKIVAIAVGCDPSGVLANKVSEKAAKVIGTDSVDVKRKVEAEKKNMIMSRVMTRLVQSGLVSSEAALEDMLSRPTEAVVEACRRLKGDVILLGVGGKMGPSLARMVRRASDLAGVRRRVLGVSRFGSGDLQSRLQADGIVTIRCDLLDESAVEHLPDAANVIYLAGMKFGACGQEARTWAMNVYVPALVCRRYWHSTLVAFSSGNVYGLAPVAGGGSKETDVPAPVGEYAMSCLGRERMFEHFSRAWSIPVVLIRLNYACELRYGVLVDIAKKIAAGQPVDTTMGFFNTIWQGDANAIALQSFALAASPPLTLNLTGPNLLSVREVGTELAKRMGKPVTFIGNESSTAILSDASIAIKRFGPLGVSTDLLMDWVADWVKRGGPSLNKPTHFEVRDGVF